MKRNYLLLYFILLVTLIFLAPLTESSEEEPIRLATSEERNKYLIPESIGYFQPRDETFLPVMINIYGSSDKMAYGLPFPALSAGEYRAKYYNYHYLDRSIVMGYYFMRNCGEGDRINFKCPVAGVEVSRYKDPQYLKQDIINRYMDWWWEFERGGHVPGLKDIKLVSINRSEFIFTKMGKSDKLIWQSGNYVVRLGGEMEYSKDMSLLDAYLEKYPPTWTIKVDDFNPELALKNEIDHYLEIIFDFEKKRITLDKYKIYEAMNYQCEFESNIRCWTGETGRGCPITMELNNLKRKNKFKEFAEKARKKPVDTEKYHSMAMFVTECQVLDQEAAIADKLGILQDMIKE